MKIDKTLFATNNTDPWMEINLDRAGVPPPIPLSSLLVRDPRGIDIPTTPGRSYLIQLRGKRVHLHHVAIDNEHLLLQQLSLHSFILGLGETVLHEPATASDGEETVQAADRKHAVYAANRKDGVDPADRQPRVGADQDCDGVDAEDGVASVVRVVGVGAVAAPDGAVVH